MEWVPSGSALSAISTVSLDRSLPDQEVAPEDEPPHPGTGERRGRVLTDLAGRQQRVKNLRHRLVAGGQPGPATTTRRSEHGGGGAEHPITGRGEDPDKHLPHLAVPGQGHRGEAAPGPH